MKYFAQYLVAIVLTTSLSVAGFASASVLNSAQSFNAGRTAHFAHTTSSDHTDFDDHYTFTTSARGDHSVFATDSIGPSFNRRLNDSRKHSKKSYGESHRMDVDDREIDLHDWHRDERNPVSPVPEPAAYVLMACGLGLLGFVTTRRRQAEIFTVA